MSNPIQQALDEIAFQREMELKAMPPYMQLCVLAMQQSGDSSKAFFVKAVKDAAGHLDETSNGLALIHRAARQSDVFYLKHLVEAGADFNLMSGRTPSFPPIAEAVLEGNQEHVDFLLAQKADLSLCDDNGVSFVFELFKQAVNDMTTMMKRSAVSAVTSLMPHLDHDLRDSRGRPLMVAALENLPFKAVEALRGSRYPVCLVDIETALMHGRYTSMALLLEGADIVKSVEDANRLKSAIATTRRIMVENVTTSSLHLHAQNFWGVRGEVFAPESCIAACLKTVEHFYLAERQKFEKAIDKIYTGGDKPLPLPRRRM